ncbi:MAG: four helix bundle protein [Rickettsiales bacterium]|nr:four helix bundle protein [Rickettsiales bacterium]
MTDSVIAKKSFLFAVRVTNLYKYLLKKGERVLSRQVLRSGTSIGANANEAISAQSNKDFIAKLSVSLKEARETLYWPKLLKLTDFLTEQSSKTIIDECDEIIAILVSILKTSKKNAAAKKLTHNSELVTLNS